MVMRGHRVLEICSQEMGVVYALAMAIIYNKLLVLFVRDYSKHNLLGYIHPLLRPFTSIVGGGGQKYVLLMAYSLTSRMY